MNAHRQRPGRQTGFTLIELLVVCTIVAMMMGLAAGAISRASRGGVLKGASRMVRSALGRARALAQVQGSLARVVLVPGDEARGVVPRLELGYARTAGTWHFEDEEISGQTIIGGGLTARLLGASVTESGRVRRGAIFASAGRVQAPPLTQAPTHDPRRGFILDLEILPRGPGQLARFGDPETGESAFVFALEDDGSLSGEVTTAPQGTTVKLRTPPGVIDFNGGWARVMISYDGVDFELAAHGAVEVRVAEARDLAVPAAGALMLGGGFQGALDEAVYRTVSDPEVVELDQSINVPSKEPITVRFDRDGRLHPRFHKEPVVLTLRHEDEQLTVVVELAGVMR